MNTVLRCLNPTRGMYKRTVAQYFSAIAKSLGNDTYLYLLMRFLATQIRQETSFNTYGHGSHLCDIFIISGLVLNVVYRLFHDVLRMEANAGVSKKRPSLRFLIARRFFGPHTE